MPRLPLVTTALALFLVGCDNSVPLDTPEVDAFKPELAEGHLASEHTEVAPGVYVLSDVVNAGWLRYVSAEEQAARQSNFTSPDYCYNYDDENYLDELTGGTMFGGNPSWYGVANAWSYHYDPVGTRNDQDYEQVSSYLWSYNDTAVANIYVYSYVYVNGEYVGYVYETARRNTTALGYAVFDATCVDGSVSVETRNYHSWSDRAGTQYLYLANTATASVECCPD